MTRRGLPAPPGLFSLLGQRYQNERYSSRRHQKL